MKKAPQNRDEQTIDNTSKIYFKAMIYISINSRCHYIYLRNRKKINNVIPNTEKSNRHRLFFHLSYASPDTGGNKYASLFSLLSFQILAIHSCQDLYLRTEHKMLIEDNIQIALDLDWDYKILSINLHLVIRLVS